MKYISMHFFIINLKGSFCFFNKMAKKTKEGILMLFYSLILEVFGGVGAVWGCAEAWNLRDSNNGNEWRLVSIIVGTLCLWRWVVVCLMPIFGWCWKKRNMKAYEYVYKFLLEVLGGVGAIWGSSEICGLRTAYPPDCQDTSLYLGGAGESWSPGFEDCKDSNKLWRIFCVFFLCYFFLWWGRFDFAVTRGMTEAKMKEYILYRFLDGFSSFILEVLGACGALWGLAEVLRIRGGWSDEYFGQPDFDVWRIVSAIIFPIFMVFWRIKHFGKNTAVEKNEVNIVVVAEV